ncbi:MAG: hypothetical protein K6G86_07830 [Bacteroidales bacterium]|nr:hypothetical protein [Bacteroidales bacterium]
MIQDEINALESRQLELQAIMASSDAHAAKCVKLGRKFSTLYPEEAEAYAAANEEFNANEETLRGLYNDREALAATEEDAGGQASEE